MVVSDRTQGTNSTSVGWIIQVLDFKVTSTFKVLNSSEVSAQLLFLNTLFVESNKYCYRAQSIDPGFFTLINMRRTSLTCQPNVKKKGIKFCCLIKGQIYSHAKGVHGPQWPWLIIFIYNVVQRKTSKMLGGDGFGLCEVSIYFCRSQVWDRPEDILLFSISFSIFFSLFVFALQVMDIRVSILMYFADFIFFPLHVLLS